MENGTSLDDIFGGGTPGDEEQAETIGQPRDDHGRFASKEPGEEQQEAPEAQEGTPPSEQQEPSHIPIAALKDERTKRQQLEAERQQMAERLQQYEAYFQQLQNGGQEEEPDPIQLIAQQVMSQLQPQQEMQMLTQKVDFAEALARQKWADYDEKVEHFKEAAKANPFLIQELRAAANPAEYAYGVANKILEAKQYSQQPSREDDKARMRAEIMAELGMSNQPKAPTTLADERSLGSRSGPAWAGPTPISQIFGS